MAKFCGNCGMQLEDDARICGNCGTPYEGEEENRTGIAPKTKKKIKKIALLSIIGVVVIIIGIISLNIITYMTGYERTVNIFVQALSDYDIDKALSVSSDAGFTSDSILNFEDSFESMVSNWLDGFEFQVGHDVKITCEMQESYKLSDRKRQSFLQNLEEIFEYDTDDISEIVCATVKLHISGSRSDKTFPSREIYIFKENGKWLIYLGSSSFVSNSNLTLSANYNSLFN